MISAIGVTYLFSQALLFERPHERQVILGDHCHFIFHTFPFAGKFFEDSKLCHESVSQCFHLILGTITWFTSE